MRFKQNFNNRGILTTDFWQKHIGTKTNGYRRVSKLFEGFPPHVLSELYKHLSQSESCAGKQIDETDKRVVLVDVYKYLLSTELSNLNMFLSIRHAYVTFDR